MIPAASIRSITSCVGRRNDGRMRRSFRGAIGIQPFHTVRTQTMEKRKIVRRRYFLGFPVLPPPTPVPSTPPQPVPTATSTAKPMTTTTTTAGKESEERVTERAPSHSLSADFSHSNFSQNSCSLDSKSPQPSAGGPDLGETVGRLGATNNAVATPDGFPWGRDFYHGREPRLGKMSGEPSQAGMCERYLTLPCVWTGIPSSASTSDNESCAFSGTLESSELKMWIRSESENSVPSWASSISLDSQSEEAVLDFMKRFVRILFHDSSSITLQLKSDFGQFARVSWREKKEKRMYGSYSLHRLNTFDGPELLTKQVNCNKFPSKLSLSLDGNWTIVVFPFG